MMNRRTALKLTMGSGVSCAVNLLSATPQTAPIIDCHIHLFDTTRTGGVPWPEKSDRVIYSPALPYRYMQIARPLGVVGAIAVEASPLESDNYWVLQQAADHPIIVGFIGDLVPGAISYEKALKRLKKNPLFLGIRYGNLWGRDLRTDIRKPSFVSGLRQLAAEGLVLDSANPNSQLIRALLDISSRIPELRIVIDHLPHAAVPEESAERKEYWTNLERLGQNPHIFVKLSEIPVKQGDRVPLQTSTYQQNLDAIWGIFGEDRVLYGSDWPNSDHVASYATTLGIVRRYVSGKGAAASEKFFWKNSIAAYRWRRREADQPVLNEATR